MNRFANVEVLQGDITKIAADALPAHWLNELARKEDIENLCVQFTTSLQKK